LAPLFFCRMYLLVSHEEDVHCSFFDAQLETRVTAGLVGDLQKGLCGGHHVAHAEPADVRLRFVVRLVRLEAPRRKLIGGVAVRFRPVVRVGLQDVRGRPGVLGAGPGEHRLHRRLRPVGVELGVARRQRGGVRRSVVPGKRDAVGPDPLPALFVGEHVRSDGSLEALRDVGDEGTGVGPATAFGVPVDARVPEPRGHVHDGTGEVGGVDDDGPVVGVVGGGPFADGGARQHVAEEAVDAAASFVEMDEAVGD